MRQQIVAGNWKMNTTPQEGLALCREVLTGIAAPRGEVVLAPPFTHIHALAPLLEGAPHVSLGAQNCHQEEKGAYTGEVSAGMLAAAGVRYVIIGHSERRQYFQEDNALLARKVDAALAHGLRPIFCCGEPLVVRDQASHVPYVAAQLEESLFHLSPEQFAQVVIAYEPIWAIGTGQTATSAQAQEMHAAIRDFLAGKYGHAAADNTTILYGGSCNAQNAPDLFRQPDVDGGLIGGASLKAPDFLAIINALKDFGL